MIYTNANLIIVVSILLFLSAVNYILRRGSAWSTLRRRGIKTIQPPPIPPVQLAVGVPVAHLPNPYPPYSGTLRISDPLQDNRAGYHWMDDSVKPTNETRGCHFCDNAYHIPIGNQPQPHMIYCLALRTNFSDFVYQIEATLLRGIEIGIVFRQTPGYRFYYFYIRRDGTYGLVRNTGSQHVLLAQGSSHIINTGLNQPNVLAVVANGSSIDLYVNLHHLTHIVDDLYRAGRIGIGTSVPDNHSGEAVFRNVMLWTLDETAQNNDL